MSSVECGVWCVECGVSSVECRVWATGGLGGGKVAVIIIASVIAWRKDGQDEPIYVHVIHLPPYEPTLPDSLIGLLEGANTIAGHNVKSDATRLKHDFNVTIRPEAIDDTMQMAKLVLGPRVAWDPRTKHATHPHTHSTYSYLPTFLPSYLPTFLPTYLPTVQVGPLLTLHSAPRHRRRQGRDAVALGECAAHSQPDPLCSGRRARHSCTPRHAEGPAAKWG